MQRPDDSQPADNSQPPILNYATPELPSRQNCFGRALAVAVPFGLWSGLFMFAGLIAVGFVAKIDGVRFDWVWIAYPVVPISVFMIVLSGLLSLLSCWLRLRFSRRALCAVRYSSLAAMVTAAFAIGSFVVDGPYAHLWNEAANAWLFFAPLASSLVLLR